MEDAAEAGADDAEPKKQYLLDRIATSDGFKDAKAHKEEDDAAPEAADAKATEESSSGEDASPPIPRSMKRLRKARRRPRTPPPSTDWRDGSASDSSPEGYAFESRIGH